MYADTVTRSMQRAIDETNRRRKIQVEYNERHQIVPVGVKKEVRALSDRLKVAEAKAGYDANAPSLQTIPREEALKLIKDLEGQMRKATKDLEFERAAELRDQIIELRRFVLE